MANVLSCSECSEEYSVGLEHAGSRFACRGCGAEVVVPDAAGVAALPPEPVAPPAGAAAAGTGTRGPFDRDKFLVNQKRVSLSERYYIYDEGQEQVLFVDRPTRWLRQFAMIGGAVLTFFVFAALTVFVIAALGEAQVGDAIVGGVTMTGMALTIAFTVVVSIALSPKRHVTFHADDSQEARTSPLLTVFQDQKVALINATYTVKSGDGSLIGFLEKNHLHNFIRKQWRVLGPRGELIVIVKEDSLIKSLARRFFGPLFGLLRTNFVYLEPGSERTIGEFNRKLTLFDRYVLDMSADTGRILDRRLALASGVLLDTGERR